MTDLMRWAHDYGALGLRVFPLMPREKKPYPHTHGLDDATDDVERIVAWWEGHEPIPTKNGRRVMAGPASNIGLATGSRSGFFVLDVDGQDGVRSLMKMANAYAPLPATVRQNTGKGGHLCFAWPEGAAMRNKAGSLGKEPGKPAPFPGLDIRADGGYIVAAPSIHPTGRPYRWVDGCSPFDRPFAAAPRWLLDLIEPPEPPPEPVSARAAAKVRPLGDGDAYAAAALNGACDAIAAARPGTQNVELHSRAFSIGRLVAGGVIGRERAREALIRAGLAMAAGNPRDPWTRQTVEKAVDHAFGRAVNHPKQAPERRGGARAA